MSSIVEAASALTVGTVESVAPDEIKVILEHDAPQATALNTGVPSRFPRLNGFVLIPNETGALVGLVSWLGVERASYPKRPGLRDFGLVDLPFPVRKMSVNPVGTLKIRTGDGSLSYELERGVAVFPSVGDPVALPTRAQLRSIVESQGSNARVVIGTSPLTADASVAVDPDKMFGRHLAILGNTGSGKSCTVAGLIRWSLEASRLEREKLGRTGDVNARFIILDPNGEYAHTFTDLGSRVRLFRARLFGEDHDEDGLESQPLTVPAWMWNSHEWVAFTQASAGYQRPLLLQALRGLRSGAETTDDPGTAAARTIRGYRSWLDAILRLGPAAYGGDWGTRMQCGSLLRMLADSATAHADRAPDHRDALEGVVEAANGLASAKTFDWKGKPAYESFGEEELLALAEAVDIALEALPPVELTFGISEDMPSNFTVRDLPGYLEVLSRSEDYSQGAQYLPTLLTRIKTMLGDPRLAPIVHPEQESPLAEWLDDYVGANNATNGQIAIIDLSLIPSDVLHLTIAVIGRLVFEASQRYRKLNGRELPTTIVLEEAHSFVRRGQGDDGGDTAAAALCRETFEKIAREGRKFGVGLVLSSQRPSELSPTALAQCNTFLLHRIVNDRDQQLVSRLVPDNLGGLLRDLPSLPSRQAILLGWAAPIPVLVQIRHLAQEHRPRSEDPKFWAVWTGAEPRPIDWPAIQADWLGAHGEAPT
jgi:DNA helicase HerA-like ATPase